MGLTLKQHNEIQTKVIIDFYKSFPDTEKLLEWVKLYAERFRKIIDDGITVPEEIERILYKKN